MSLIVLHFVKIEVCCGQSSNALCIGNAVEREAVETNLFSAFNI